MSWKESEINERLPIWNVLSEFWLDTSLDDADFVRIGTVLAASPYSKEQLWQICIYEVAPAVSANLLCVAGEWSGFDSEWLIKAIIQKSPDSQAYLTPSIWRKFRGFMHGSLVKSSGWDQIADQL